MPEYPISYYTGSTPEFLYAGYPQVPGTPLWKLHQRITSLLWVKFSRLLDETHMSIWRGRVKATSQINARIILQALQGLTRKDMWNNEIQFVEGKQIETAWPQGCLTQDLFLISECRKKDEVSRLHHHQGRSQCHLVRQDGSNQRTRDRIGELGIKRRKLVIHLQRTRDLARKKKLK